MLNQVLIKMKWYRAGATALPGNTQKLRWRNTSLLTTKKSCRPAIKGITSALRGIKYGIRGRN